jgi:hypothetical protein
MSSPHVGDDTAGQVSRYLEIPAVCMLKAQVTREDLNLGGGGVYIWLSFCIIKFVL